MSPLFMDTGCESSSSSCSVSAEESRSNTAGWERQGEGRREVNRVTKRQEKNRDAARKSRRKQTERADELHEELQSLEQSNSALQKEIASLKKDLHLYTTALERHMPFCRLKAPVSSLSAFPSAGGQIGVPPQALSTTQAAPPSLSTSSTPSRGLQTSPAAQLLTSSGSLAAPYSVSFCTGSPPHSLFSKEPSSLLTSRPTSPPPVCTSLFSNLSSSLRTAAQPLSEPGISHDSLSTLHSHETMKQGLFQTASAASPAHSGLLCSRLSPPPPHPALQSFLASPPHTILEPSPASVFAPKPSPGLHTAPCGGSLLSLLTVPGPLGGPPPTSSCPDAPLSQAPPSLPGACYPDLSLSELLEVNEWILQS